VVFIPRDLAGTDGVALRTSEWVVQRWRLRELQALVPDYAPDRPRRRVRISKVSRILGAGGEAFRLAYEQQPDRKNPRFACLNFSRRATNQSYVVLQHWLIDTGVPFLFLANKNGGKLWGGMLNAAVKA
jgi:hypothetical protein